MMENQKFEVKGTFLMGEDWAPYTKIIAAPNAKQATERTFAVIGSKHNLKRRYIKVDAVKLVTAE
jgi:large subunit ribosomal protein LX